MMFYVIVTFDNTDPQLYGPFTCEREEAINRVAKKLGDNHHIDDITAVVPNQELRLS